MPQLVKNPTLRKLRNRGLTPIRYHMGGYHSSVRHGWLTGQETRTKVQIHLVGEDGNRWIRKDEMRYVEVL